MNKTPRTAKPTTPETFLRRILPMVGEVFGAVGYVKVSPSVLVRIELTNMSAQAQLWNGFKVQRVHAMNGVIDTVWIPFAEALAGVGRKDTRPDYDGPFEVKTGAGLDWYISVPADERPLAAAVNRYLAMWK